jgi:hypothetical protein
MTEEEQLERDVIETAVRLRRCVVSQSSNKVASKESIAAYSDYSSAVGELVDYRDKNGKG